MRLHPRVAENDRDAPAGKRLKQSERRRAGSVWAKHKLRPAHNLAVPRSYRARIARGVTKEVVPRRVGDHGTPRLQTQQRVANAGRAASLKRKKKVGLGLPTATSVVSELVIAHCAVPPDTEAHTRHGHIHSGEDVAGHISLVVDEAFSRIFAHVAMRAQRTHPPISQKLMCVEKEDDVGIDRLIDDDMLTNAIAPSEGMDLVSQNATPRRVGSCRKKHPHGIAPTRPQRPKTNDASPPAKPTVPDRYDAVTMSSTSSSLILGVATGLPPTFAEPFVHSLRSTGYRGRLGLVLGHYQLDDIRHFKRLADFAIAVDDQYEPVNSLLVDVLRTMRNTRRIRRAYPFAFRLAATTRERRKLAKWRALEYRLEGLQALRYGHYYDILHQEGIAGEEVLLTDVRDVLFQRDPFDPPVTGLEVFLEEPDMTIGSEWFTRRWMLSLYGPREVAAFGEEIASCSGTVVGPREDILHYLKEMCQEMTWRRRPLGSHDQAVHNHLLRCERLDPVTIVGNGQGRVLTMAGMARIARDERGRILTRTALCLQCSISTIGIRVSLSSLPPASVQRHSAGRHATVTFAAGRRRVFRPRLGGLCQAGGPGTSGTASIRLRDRSALLTPRATRAQTDRCGRPRR